MSHMYTQKDTHECTHIFVAVLSRVKRYLFITQKRFPLCVKAL